MASHDPSEDYDGGWESGLDGGEVLTDVLLGPVHPYDRPDGYTPAQRWGTRHEVVSRPFADPIDRIESDGGIDAAVKSVRTPPRRRTSTAAKVMPQRQVARRQATTKKTLPAPKPNRQERTERVAAELGWTVGELQDFRRRVAAAQAAPTEIKNKVARLEALAATVGVDVDVLKRLRAAEARAAAPPPRPAKRDLRSLPRTQDEMIAATLKLGPRLTSKGYPARFFEAGVLLGMTRDEVMRAVDNHVPKPKPAVVKPPKPVPTAKVKPTAAPVEHAAAPPAPPARPATHDAPLSKKQQRLALIARRLGVAPSEVSKFRAIRARLSGEFRGLSPTARQKKLAAEVQWPFQWVADLERLETVAVPKPADPKPSTPKPPSKRAARPPASDVRASSFCPACGCRVGVTGWCRCS